MSFLIMALLTLVCFFERYPAPPWNGSPLIPLALAMLGMGVVAGHAFWISRAFTSPSSKDRAFPFDLLTTFEKRRYRHQILQVAIFLACLVFLGWGWAVRQLWSSGAGELPGLELLLLAPFLLGQLASWLCFYDADQAVHSAINYGNDGNSWSHSWLDARSPASRAFAGRWSYVALQARQTFALVLIPVALLILQKELGRLLPASWRQSSELVTGLGLGSLALVIFFMPLILRVILGLRPIPDGPLRDRLEKTSQRLGFRCSNLLLWNTQMGMANAMVIGLSPWLRYVVFTDRLIEDFSPEEVEAVLGHEIGHIRHRHMPTYLLFLSGSMVVLGLLADHYFLPAMASAADSLRQSITWLPSWLPAQLGPGGDLGSVPIAIAMLLYIFGIFGYLSRGCERQADIFGCRAVSCSNPVCQSHEGDILLPDRGGHLCPTGIRTFIRALNKVALINGISRDRPGFLQSWQHSTIERRVDFLERMLFNPRVELQFQRGLLAVKMVLLGGLGIGLGILTHLHGWPW